MFSQVIRSLLLLQVIFIEVSVGEGWFVLVHA